MIKAKVIKPFYYAKDKELYLEKDRYNELKKLGLVEIIEEIASFPIDEIVGNKESTQQIKKTTVKNSKIEKATNDKTRILSN